jgi:hypothetical protein
MYFLISLLNYFIVEEKKGAYQNFGGTLDEDENEDAQHN